jgi:hypothetical protein
MADAPKKPSLKERLSALFADYGRIAVITYLVLSLGAIVGFSIAIGMGVEPSDATGVLGVIGAGWVAAKATMPIRILITLGITPVIAGLLRRRKPRGDEPGGNDPEASI